MRKWLLLVTFIILFQATAVEGAYLYSRTRTPKPENTGIKQPVEEGAPPKITIDNMPSPTNTAGVSHTAAQPTKTAMPVILPPTPDLSDINDINAKTYTPPTFNTGATDPTCKPIYLEGQKSGLYQC